MKSRRGTDNPNSVPPRVTPTAWAGRTDYALVHCDHLATTPYADSVPGVPLVFCDYDVESHALSTLAAAQSNPFYPSCWPPWSPAWRRHVFAAGQHDG